MNLPSEQYIEELNGITNGAVSRVDLTVAIDWNNLLDQHVFSLLREVRRINPMLSDVPTEDQLRSYLYSLLVTRVDAVNGEKNELVRSLKTACVPVLFYQMLVKIGRVYVKDYNITISPRMVPHSAEELSSMNLKVMSRDEFRSLSDDLKSLQSFGLASTDAAPTQPEGEIEFMSGMVLDQEVVSLVGHSGSPVIGFLVALANARVVETHFHAMYRTWYGRLDDFEARVTRVTKASNSVRL